MNLSQVFTGISSISKLVPSNNTPDTMDIIEALEVFRASVEDTKEFVGKAIKRKYVKKKKRRAIVNCPYHEDVASDLHEYFMTDTDDRSTAIKRHKNRLLYVLFVMPLVQVLEQISHEEMINQLNGIIDLIKSRAVEDNTPTMEEDDKVLRAMVMTYKF